MTHYLLCTDLDRTLIPNGVQQSSPSSLAVFAEFVRREHITLAYVSGRHLELVEDAIHAWHLPQPRFAICDVGSSIYQHSEGEWHVSLNWQQWIAASWENQEASRIAMLLDKDCSLQLQEAEKQGNYKLSFYAEAGTDTQKLMARLQQRLESQGMQSNLIWSIDTARNLGLLDILPARAGKLQAIRFLMQEQGFDLQHTLFAGDSGNDLDVMLSDIPSILVANAEADIKHSVQAAHADTLYIAKGSWHGMNGNYSAGILEGIDHFWPEAGLHIPERA